MLGRTLDRLVALINMYKNRYGIVAILVSMFWGCSETWLDNSLRGWLYVDEMQDTEVWRSGGCVAWRYYGPSYSANESV